MKLFLIEIDKYLFLYNIIISLKLLILDFFFYRFFNACNQSKCMCKQNISVKEKQNDNHHNTLRTGSMNLFKSPLA